MKSEMVIQIIQTACGVAVMVFVLEITANLIFNMLRRENEKAVLAACEVLRGDI